MTGLAAASERTAPPPGAHTPLSPVTAGQARVRLPHTPDHPSCFACGPHAPSGLGLRVTETDAQGITALVTLTDVHQGAPGIAHGGIVAAVLDEATSLAVWHVLNRPNVTGRLEIQFLAPVPLGRPLYLRAKCAAVHGRKAYATAELHTDGPDGAVAATAAAVYIAVQQDHFDHPAKHHAGTAPPRLPTPAGAAPRC
ncbi:PaaI family thioesterase [Streptomyces longisporoflavus]|uniref:Acyl-coenzyme A thioesterase THEM4 n=1 Tax=Streptomyces longisporoflavus TaxID=28044 RepID=A0ABW7R2E1_9ACTN